MPRWLARLFGNRGEKLAAKYLERAGYRILARQFTCRAGEIDLIALDGGTVVFVEVKSRRSDAAGHPAEAVTEKKQSQMVRAALFYLKRYNLLEQPSRFDVVAIVWPADNAQPEITHYRNAFSPAGQGQFYS